MDLLRSLPLGLYLEQPVTWLHRMDARIKLAWLMAFLITPILANSVWRIGLVVFLVMLTISATIPARIWRQQMLWWLSLCGLVFVLTVLSPDGLAITHQPRLPVHELTFPPAIATSAPPSARPWYNPWGGRENPRDQPAPQPVLGQPTPYRYVLFQQSLFVITQRSLNLGIRISTLLFTLIYSTNLYLLTTAPEEITTSLESWLRPLRRLNLPITEIVLTLTLSLRFIPLVLEEIQNLVRSIQTRAINWKKLGMRGAIRVWLLVVERLLENLLLRAEQISSAMMIRGFTSPNTHQVKWYQFQLQRPDWFALAMLFLLLGVRLTWGWQW